MEITKLSSMMERIVLAMFLVLKSILAVEGHATSPQMAAAFF
jgi:hypothetical protein